MWFFKRKSEKDQLWEQHIPELIAGLYLKHIQQYPDWKNSAPEYMPEAVTAVVRSDDGKTKLILNLNEYEFAFKEWSYKSPDGKSHTHGLLEIFLSGNKKIFGLLLAKGRVGDTLRWEASEVEAFEPGSWLDDFRLLADQILAIIKKKAKETREG